MSTGKIVLGTLAGLAIGAIAGMVQDIVIGKGLGGFTLMGMYLGLIIGMSKKGFVSLKVFDVLGKEVVKLVNEKLSPGIYEAEFDGSSLSSGIYFYTLTTERFTETKSMILLK